ncbi:sigma factor-like helix-turn-helix DNA-binding protein [Nocardioides sp.]|uniref:sigma factor-like helix-turn-helix DNA-binding protein n=1 Tax=Nocardioides sp. TaxID=35761 RepID=UPI0027258858|nr:sigma factor-like helix-turn-helix DNA-binding protein [Nocardioides sp.]MDO9455221.1 sigma factor-like helix-turn-helix DNA-binding protein [Nocardioides sp.]
MLAVKEAGYSGEPFDLGADLLIGSAVERVKAMVLTGRMFDECARLGRPVPSATAGLRQLRACPSDLDLLAWHVVERAWARFLRDALMSSKWNPEGGATLVQWLVGTCIQEFKDSYKQWLPGYLRRSDILVDPTSMTELLTNPSGIAAGRDAPPFYLDEEAEDLLEQLPDITQQTVVLIALGYSKTEVAAILGITPSAVRSQLARARTALDERYPGRRRA